MPIAVYPNGRREVTASIEAILDAVGPLAGAAYVGSTASGRVDRYSDIDLIVGCSAEQATCFVNALHADLGVALCLVTAGGEPSGAYWLATADPMLRLDITFLSAAEFAEVLREASDKELGTMRVITCAGGELHPGVEVAAPTFSTADHAFAEALLAFQDALKKTARGSEPERPLHVCWEAVEALPASPGAERIYDRCFTVFEEGVREGQF